MEDNREENINGSGFNTLRFTEQLIHAGVPKEQAQAQALALYEVINSNMATKRYIREIDLKIETVRAELKRDIEDVRTELKRDIQEVRTELKRDIKEIDVKVEGFRAELKRDLKEMETRLELKIETMGYKFRLWVGVMLTSAMGIIFAMAKAGLLSVQ